jgi:hypothetical protein
MKRVSFFALVVCFLLSACGTRAYAKADVTSTPVATQSILPPTPSVSVRESVTESVDTIRLSASPSVTQFVSLSATPTLDPTDWKNWPVIPNVDSSVRRIYQFGQTLGNDPHAFSIFGDCQSRPDAFFGVFETDSAVIESLSPELQATIENFRGSFNRESPTSQDGTTPGALLWTQWHRGEYGCSFTETPVVCELRIHHPSFVIIQIGTHFESRNTEYLRKIILQLMDAGVVPILATKADNRERDDRINKDMAALASEYDLPLWNFWAALSDLPNRGLYVMQGRELQGAIYLDDEASLRHRMTGLEVLNVVWRAAKRN